LADEPTGSLDTAAGQELLHLLRQLNQTQGTTFLVVTHDPSVARQTNRMVVMRDGQIIAENIIGSPEEEDLKTWRASDLARSILQDAPASYAALNLSSTEVQVLQKLLAGSPRG
jgi:ABC-type glutathione transport system ATPase component